MKDTVVMIGPKGERARIDPGQEKAYREKGWTGEADAIEEEPEAARAAHRESAPDALARPPQREQPAPNHADVKHGGPAIPGKDRKA